MDNPKIAVVIPCYKVKEHILGVIQSVHKEVDTIYVVDDCCPDSSGSFVEEHNNDKRVKVLYNKQNLGVGGATMHGYKEALANDIDIVVKVDGDGQMDATLILDFIKPILDGNADYVKGNRFFSYEHVSSMPKVRLIGN